jgi:hypothetical protein
VHLDALQFRCAPVEEKAPRRVGLADIERATDAD